MVLHALLLSMLFFVLFFFTNTNTRQSSRFPLSDKILPRFRFNTVFGYILNATPRMAFPYIKKNDGCHFCMETGFLITQWFSYKAMIRYLVLNRRIRDDLVMEACL